MIGNTSHEHYGSRTRPSPGSAASHPRAFGAAVKDGWRRASFGAPHGQISFAAVSEANLDLEYSQPVVLSEHFENWVCLLGVGLVYMMLSK